MTNFQTYNGSVVYLKKHIQLQWHNGKWGRLCWIFGIKELSVWDCIKELVKQCTIYARGTQNCHFWLLKQMKIKQYTSYSGTMPASRYKCAKSRQAEPWQSVFLNVRTTPSRNLMRIKLNKTTVSEISKWTVVATAHLATEPHSTPQVARKSSLETVPQTCKANTMTS